MKKPARYPARTYHDPDDRRMVQIIKASTRPRPNALNILGVPYDGAVLGRKGAAGGPAAIREAMAGFSNYNVELGVGVEDATVCDLGDLVVSKKGVSEAHRQIESEVGKDLLEGSMLVILGGDNSISLPTLSAASKKFGKLGLVVVDSHLDLRGKVGGEPTSGSSYGLAMERQLVNPRNVVEIGAHGFLNSKLYVEKARGLGITLVTAEEVSRRGPRSVARAAYSLASNGADAVYISFDLDAVDLAQASGVSAPSAGGMWARNAFTLMYELAKMEKVKCVDLVELAPALDPTGSSQRVAAASLVYMIAGFHTRGTETKSRSL